MPVPVLNTTAARRQGMNAKPHLYKSFAGWVCAGNLIVVGASTAFEAFETYEARLSERARLFNPRTRYADERDRMYRPWRPY